MITKYFEQINIAYEDIKAGKYNKLLLKIVKSVLLSINAVLLSELI